MFAVGFIFLFVLSFIEALNLKKISEKKEVNNFLVLVLSFSGFLVSLISFLIMSSIEGTEIDFVKESELFKNPIFYIALLSEIIGIILARKNYEVNSCNMTAINFSLFFSLAIVPIYSFFFSDLYGFGDNLKVNYQSNTEFVMFVSGMTLLTILYFFDKVKGKINSIYWLIPYPLVLSNSMFVTSSLMQQYNGFFVYGSIVLSLSFVFLFLSIRKREFKNITKEHLKLSVFLFLGWTIAIPANTFAVKILAVEFVNILKRLCQIITGTILDKAYKNTNNHHWKDKYIIGLMFIFSFLFYYYRG